MDWDADLILGSQEISDGVKQDILGSKRSILFVEGEYSSLDRQIYQLIYSDVTVLPQGSCAQVEKAVEGIKGTQSLHWVNAYGLVDADDRTPSQIQSLSERGIAALECYSVESLYYNLEIVERIAKRQAAVTGVNEAQLFIAATANIIRNIVPHKERLCARLCEKKARNKVMSQLPKHKDIAQRSVFEIKFDLNEFLKEEEEKFDNFVASNNLSGLLSRYPIRETPVLKGITDGLGFGKDTYESAVRKLVIDDVETRNYYRTLLAKLTSLIKPIS